MIKTYKMNKRLQPVTYGPRNEIEFWRKMYIKFNRVYYFLNTNHFVDFAETAMAQTDSCLAHVNISLNITYLLYITYLKLTINLI